jgi:hypothetical protein
MNLNDKQNIALVLTLLSLLLILAAPSYIISNGDSFIYVYMVE